MTVADADKRFAECSVRDLQRYAAACLEAYCQGKGIRHPAVDELIQHLKGYPDRDSVLAWERAGALLALNGRGDDWPQDLVALIPPSETEAFSSLVDSAVEVGLVDLFGESTDLSVIFVHKIISILRGHSLELPELPGARAI